MWRFEGVTDKISWWSRPQPVLSHTHTHTHHCHQSEALPGLTAHNSSPRLSTLSPACLISNPHPWVTPWPLTSSVFCSRSTLTTCLIAMAQPPDGNQVWRASRVDEVMTCAALDGDELCLSRLPAAVCIAPRLTVLRPQTLLKRRFYDFTGPWAKARDGPALESHLVFVEVENCKQAASIFPIPKS